MGPPGRAAPPGHGCHQQGGPRPTPRQILGSGSLFRGRSHPMGVTPSCLQLQAPEPAGRVAESLPLPRGGVAGHWLSLCPSQAGPLCSVCGLSASGESGCPLRGAPGRERLPPAGWPEPRAPACGLSALWPPSWCVASRAGPVCQGLRGQHPPGSPAQQRPAVLTDRERRGVHSFCWVAPAGKAAQAETGAQISGGHTGPGPPSGPFCTSPLGMLAVGRSWLLLRSPGSEPLSSVLRPLLAPPAPLPPSLPPSPAPT